MQYETEEQQVEAIKEWWKENGVSVAAGVLIGLLGVFGWRAWVAHKNMVAAEASYLFEQLITSVELGKKAPALQQATSLRSDYTSTPYATFADLMEARERYEQGDATGAQEALKQAIAKAPNEDFATVAILRLARLQISSGDFLGAQALLDQHPATTAFTAEYAALRGDIARAKGDMAGARRAYREAIKGKVGSADLIQLKLDNLPPDFVTIRPHQ